jgi:hypothetical protein
MKKDDKDKAEQFQNKYAWNVENTFKTVIFGAPQKKKGIEKNRVTLPFLNLWLYRKRSSGPRRRKRIHERIRKRLIQFSFSLFVNIFRKVQKLYQHIEEDNPGEAVPGWVIKEASKWRRNKSMKMSIIQALEKLKELNNYEEILVEFKDEEPISIDLEIDDIRKFADDPDQTFDLIVTEYTIRELDENGKEKLGEPLYKVIK